MGDEQTPLIKVSLYEKVFKVYKMGGWPCGWKGEYMKGKMIVYLPNENEGLHTDILYEFHEIYCETIIER